MPEKAATKPAGIRISPAMRCQLRLTRRAGTNWNAPSRQYTVAPAMWAITGSDEAKKRALSGVIAPPPVSWLRRNMPAITGMRLSRMRPVAASHPLRCFGRLGLGCPALVRVMVSSEVIPRCSPDRRREASGGRTRQEPYFRLTGCGPNFRCPHAQLGRISKHDNEQHHDSGRVPQVRLPGGRPGRDRPPSPLPRPAKCSSRSTRAPSAPQTTAPAAVTSPLGSASWPPSAWASSAPATTSWEWMSPASSKRSAPT